MRSGLEDAESLQQMLAVLLKTVLDSNAAAAAFHEKTLDTFMQRTSREISIVMTALSTVVSSTTALNEQMVNISQSLACFDLLHLMLT